MRRRAETIQSRRRQQTATMMRSNPATNSFPCGTRMPGIQSPPPSFSSSSLLFALWIFSSNSGPPVLQHRADCLLFPSDGWLRGAERIAVGLRVDDGPSNCCIRPCSRRTHAADGRRQSGWPELESGTYTRTRNRTRRSSI